MMIRGRRIRNVERHLRGVPPGTSVVIALQDLESHSARLSVVGFTPDLEIGERILPRPRGPISRFNAEGKNLVRRDLPMETAYRQVMWRWTEWHGKTPVAQSDVRDVPYERYPRQFMPPPSLELAVAEYGDGTKLIVTDRLTYDPHRPDALRHAINLFLELFGECSVFQEGLRPILSGNVRRLNWEILPAGEVPWPRLKNRLAPLIGRLGEAKRPVVERRLELIETYGPDFTAVGRAGFSGYIVFGFEEKGVYVLESLYYGNATYVFGKTWEQLSKLTKAEILTGHLEHDRIIHREGWDQKVRALLRRVAA